MSTFVPKPFTPFQWAEQIDIRTVSASFGSEILRGALLALAFSIFLIIIFIALYGVSTVKTLWNFRLGIIWAAGLLSIGILMWGGVFGLTFVATDPSSRR